MNKNDDAYMASMHQKGVCAHSTSSCCLSLITAEKSTFGVRIARTRSIERWEGHTRFGSAGRGTQITRSGMRMENPVFKVTVMNPHVFETDVSKPFVKRNDAAAREQLNAGDMSPPGRSFWSYFIEGQR